MKKHTIFLFQGDSITDGMRGRNGDPNHCMGHGYAFSAASFLAAGNAELQPSFLNRGVSGDTSAMVLARWDSDALSLHPDVLSLLVDVVGRQNHGVALFFPFTNLLLKLFRVHIRFLPVDCDLQYTPPARIFTVIPIFARFRRTCRRGQKKRSPPVLRIQIKGREISWLSYRVTASRYQRPKAGISGALLIIRFKNEAGAEIFP